MSTLAIIGIVIAAIVVVSSLYGWTQPRFIQVEVSTRIDAHQIRIFEILTTFSNFVKWDPWSSKDPAISQKFSEYDGVVGATYSWKGNRQVGQGKMELLEQYFPETVRFALSFGNRNAAFATFHLEGDQPTTVKWTFESDLGANPMGRIIAPAMKKIIFKDFTQGLENLKKYIETNA